MKEYQTAESIVRVLSDETLPSWSIANLLFRDETSKSFKELRRVTMRFHYALRGLVADKTVVKLISMADDLYRIKP